MEKNSTRASSISEISGKQDKKLKGIGGWLFIPLFGLVSSIFSNVAESDKTDFGLLTVGYVLFQFLLLILFLKTAKVLRWLIIANYIIYFLLMLPTGDKEEIARSLVIALVWVP